MSFEYWFATSSQGGVVKYGYKELSDGVAAVSATTECGTTMILQRNVRSPLTRDQVESLFDSHLPQRQLS